jgi:two-component system, cell cycle sensor histidine kinase and response regulator CckA
VLNVGTHAPTTTADVAHWQSHYETIRPSTVARQEDELRRLQAAALDAAADAVAISSRDGAVEWANLACCTMTGLSAERIAGTPLALLLDPTIADNVMHECWPTVMAGRRWHGEFTHRWSDGTPHTYDQSVTPLFGASGTVTHVVAVQKDITERLHLEAQYRQAQKMESVGRLASGIAHDFNNLLTVINGLSDLLLKQMDCRDPMFSDVAEIRKAGERAASLTKQLLAFSRLQVMVPQIISLNDVVSGMEGLIRQLLGARISFTFIPQPELHCVKADPGQMEQVIANLVVNAHDAMPDGGQLTIETRTVFLDATYGREHGVLLQPGEYVALIVSDTGAGMNERTRARVFEPFFTTKGPGKGTGLGLSMVYGIVKQSHGCIWVYSEVGVGTTFKIYLPISADVRPVLTAASNVQTTAGRETILIVEDNGGLRNLATRLLRPRGYTVLSAATGEEALAFMAHESTHVDLLLTDVVMPGMNGRELAERLTRGRPTLKVLYMSGYTNDAAVQHGIVDANIEFLCKPFTAVSLCGKVREVLDSDHRGNRGRTL